MKQILTLFFIGFLMFSCTTFNQSSKKQAFKTVYIDDFKIKYVKKLLLESYGHSAAIQEVIGKDNSGFTEPILSESDLRIMDSLVKVDHQQMLQDSIARIGKVSEGAVGKHVFSYVLNKYNSKWLDSLATSRFRMIPKGLYW